MAEFLFSRVDSPVHPDLGSGTELTAGVALPGALNSYKDEK